MNKTASRDGDKSSALAKQGQSGGTASTTAACGSPYSLLHVLSTAFACKCPRVIAHASRRYLVFPPTPSRLGACDSRVTSSGACSTRFLLFRRTLSHIWRPFNRRSAAVQAGLGEGERRPLAGSRISMHSSNGPLSSARGACSLSSAAPCACDCIAVRCCCWVPKCYAAVYVGWIHPLNGLVPLLLGQNSQRIIVFVSHKTLRCRIDKMIQTCPRKPRCVENDSAILLQWRASDPKWRRQRLLSSEADPIRCGRVTAVSGCCSSKR